MKKLPVGIQTFRTIIEGGYVYVDKTQLIYKMLEEGIGYFLSRPRRFGKSLLVSTLTSLFQAERELFEGTWIATSDYEWEEHAVIRLNFSQVSSRSAEELRSSLNTYLISVAEELGIHLEPKSQAEFTLSRLVDELSKSNKVVLLIDEYDAPLLEQIKDQKLVESLREVTRKFFTTVKSLEDKLRFVFITGVSKFSKVSLFSGMNNLEDISLDPNFSTLLGLTEGEINQFLGEHIQATARERGRTPSKVLDEMRRWYNGYRFSKRARSEKVFNPWSVLRFLKTGLLDNYWFSTGTPTFAIEMVREQGFPVYEFDAGFQAGDEIDSTHEPDSFGLIPLLFQAGYLTVEDYDEESMTTTLRTPNEEVRRSLYKHLFHAFSGARDWETKRVLHQLVKALLKVDLPRFFDGLNQLLASIPYSIHVPRESYYHSLIYLAVQMLGFDSRAEVMTGNGRIDLTVATEKTNYVFEFKINGSAQKALDQIRERDYPAGLRSSEKRLVLVGANIDSDARTINDWIQA